MRHCEAASGFSSESSSVTRTPIFPLTTTISPRPINRSAGVDRRRLADRSVERDHRSAAKLLHVVGLQTRPSEFDPQFDLLLVARHRSRRSLPATAPLRCPARPCSASLSIGCRTCRSATAWSSPGLMHSAACYATAACNAASSICLASLSLLFQPMAFEPAIAQLLQDLHVLIGLHQRLAAAAGFRRPAFAAAAAIPLRGCEATRHSDGPRRAGRRPPSPGPAALRHSSCTRCCSMPSRVN